ncbi:MAG: DUF4870 domain-containing protein [Christensenellales bacterium]|jgi:uncharacterized membrane protein
MTNESIGEHKSSLGNIDANILALLCYIVTAILGFIPVIKYVAWLAPLIIFLIEKKSSFVKYHAMQAFLLNLVGLIIGLILGLIFSAIFAAALIANPYGFLGAAGVVSVISLIVSIVILIFSILAMIGAYKYQEYQIPLLGPLAHKITNKG